MNINYVNLDCGRNEKYVPVIKDYLLIFEKYKKDGIKLGDIFRIYKERNVEVFDKLLSFSEKYMAEFETDFFSFLNELYFEFMVIYAYQKYENENFHNNDFKFEIVTGNGELMLIDVVDFNDHCLCVVEEMRSLERDGYLKFAGGKLKKNNLTFNPSDFNSLKKAREANRFELYEAMVTKNGDIYAVLVDHLDLSKFLTANGINLKGAVRINQPSSSSSRLVLSSMYLYRNELSSAINDKQIILTRSQVETIVAFHNCLCGGRNFYSSSLDDVLYRSENLGWCMLPFSASVNREDFNLRNAKLNLREFNEASGGKVDEDGLYDKFKEEFKRRAMRDIVPDERE